MACVTALGRPRLRTSRAALPSPRKCYLSSRSKALPKLPVVHRPPRASSARYTESLTGPRERRAHESERRADDRVRRAHESERRADDLARGGHESERRADDRVRRAHESERCADDLARGAHESERRSDDLVRRAHDLRRRPHDLPRPERPLTAPPGSADPKSTGRSKINRGLVPKIESRPA